MVRKVDPEVFGEFYAEARGYLPGVRGCLERYHHQPDQPQLLEEAHRCVHSIKGSSSMLGLSGLSYLANYLEEGLDEVLGGQLAWSQEVFGVFVQTVDFIEQYLESPTSAVLERQRPSLLALIHCHRRLRGLPDEEDQLLLSGWFAAEDAESTQQLAAVEPAADRCGVSAEEEEVAPELLEVFTLEAEDHFRVIGEQLPLLDSDPENREALQEIRRSVHTLKGAAGMVGLGRLSRLAHQMEDLLDLLFEGGMKVSPDIISLLFASADALEDLASGQAHETQVQELYSCYARLLDSTSEQEPAGLCAKGEAETARESPDSTSGDQEEARKELVRGGDQYVRVPIERLDEIIKMVGELAITRTMFEQRLGEHNQQLDEMGLNRDRLRRAVTRLETEYETRALAGRSGAGGAGPGPTNRIASFFAWETPEEWDELEFDRYTEFHVLSRDLTETNNDAETIAQELRRLHGDLESVLTRQTRLASEIQDRLMRLRMVPLETLGQRLQRAVRHVAGQQGKEVILELQGAGTELDKTVLEEMADPLLHLLRNAVDHGVEPPALRQAQGKAARATITVRAYHQGTQVVLEISDDGAGLDPQRLREAAVRSGFASRAEVDALGEEALTGLLFQPGFSTAHQVSEISGRGVGLDVVRAKVQKLKGTLAVRSTPGQGTCFTIRLPLTLAIVQALLVQAGGHTYAIPMGSVRQLLRVEEDAFQVGSEALLPIAGQAYPCVHLARVVGLDTMAAETPRRPPVVLLRLGDRDVALVVDRLLGGREVVVKNLGSHLRQLPGVIGATLMGDGTVVLILNPPELLGTVTQTGLQDSARPRQGGGEGTPSSLEVMVVDDSPSVRRVLGGLLRSVGWTAIPARDGIDALEILQARGKNPDVILLDVEMPRMDGYELLTVLRNQAAYHHLPVVMVTSRAGEKHRKRALELDANAYLVKPYTDEVLLETVRNLVTENRQCFS
jgi:chemosensory pili system protein ChpA (sensor histidine kinase/response regulator)